MQIAESATPMTQLSTTDRSRVVSPATQARLDRIESFLNREKFAGFTSRDLLIPAWHAIAALSNMAESIANLYSGGRIDPEHAEFLVLEIARRAVHPKVNPYRRRIDGVADLYKWGYYLEHLNIALGALAMVNHDNAFQKLNARVSRHLRENSLKYENAHADLHAKSRMKWPADQAGILFSLWLHDQNYGTALSDEPISRWWDYLDRHAVHEETGLYITEVVGVKKFSGVPRGCALSYLTHYVGRFDPDRALTIWEGYKTHFLKKSFLGTGFREYPEGFSYRWTPDSGPILFGFGAAATGLGLNAASTVGDHETYNAVSRNLDRVLGLFGSAEKVLGNTLLTRVGTDLLATSIRLNAETKTEWRMPA